MNTHFFHWHAFLLGAASKRLLLLLGCALGIWCQCKQTDPLDEILTSKEFAAYKEAVIAQRNGGVQIGSLPPSVASTATSHEDLLHLKQEILDIRRKVDELKAGPDKIKVFTEGNAYDTTYINSVYAIIEKSQIPEVAKTALKQGLLPNILLPDAAVNKSFQALCKKYPAISEKSSVHQQLLLQINQDYESQIAR